jgi:hypothetical protein
MVIFHFLRSIEDAYLIDESTISDSLNLVRHSLLLWGKWMGVNLLIPLRLSITTQISQDAGMVIVTIAATRLYRSLTNIYSSDM